MWSELVTVTQRLAAAARRRADPAGRLPAALERTIAVLLHHYHDVGGDALVEHRWADIGEVYGLDDTERALLALPMAGDIDQNVALAYGLLHGNDDAEPPSISLALELVGIPALSDARAALGPGSILVRHDLVSIDPGGPLSTRRIRAADQLVARLWGDDADDPALAGLRLTPVPVDFAQTSVLMAHIDRGATICYIHSAPGAAGLAMAAGALARSDSAYLAVDLRTASTADTGVARSALRQATLNRQALVAVVDDTVGRQLLAVLGDALVPVVVVGSAPWRPEWLPWLPPVVTAEPLSSRGRLSIWRSMVPTLTAADESELPAFGLTPEQTRDVAHAAGADAEARGETTGPVHLTRAARVAAGAVGRLGGVRRSQPVARLADLTLAEPTRRALGQLLGWTANRAIVREQHRFLTASGSPHGVAALFTGQPGTGKSLAAQAVAAELGMELLTVDLSAVVDKYIGETEKNLEKVFQAAELLGAVLFFDEADALFGTRSQVTDSRDKYANQETAWLLQRMEAFDGLAVLATNLRANLDRAFTRRLSFVITFDPPGPELRMQLWDRFLQDVPALDAADPIDLTSLAEHADLTGGEIRNVVLAAIHAALLDQAQLGMRHLFTASAREFDKLGRRMPVQLTRPVALGRNGGSR